MKTFTVQEVRDLYNRFFREEISFTRMVEIMNEMVNGEEDIPKRKFKVGDKIRIKNGVSSKTHDIVYPQFVEEMDDFIGTTMTVDRYIDNCVRCEGICWSFHEDWLEPHEELKKGDLAIFWDSNKKEAFTGVYIQFFMGAIFQHKDHRGNMWKNAIKFESKEQYQRLIKGEI